MFRFSKISNAALAVAVTFALAGWLGQGIAIEAQGGLSAKFAAKDYAGTWNWMFQDRRFATMTLQRNGEQLGGSITNENIEMDKDGKITSASAASGSSPILRTSFQNGVLHIITKDGDEEMELAMTLSSSTTAELKFAGQGAPANAEAIRLEKVWSEPPVQP